MRIGKSKSGKKAIGIAITVMILASIFATFMPASVADSDVPPGKEARYFLVPSDPSVPGYCSETDVGVWVNVTNATGVNGGKFNITYTCCCANITSFTANTTFFSYLVPPTVVCGRLTGGFANMTGDTPPGVYHLGNFTIHCCNDSDLGLWDDELGCCVTNLTFEEGTMELANSLGDVPFAVQDGTFMCGNPIEVNKTVWNGTAWVEEIPDAQMDEIYRFRCEIHSKCCDLTNIAVVDTLSDSLEYAQNATVDGTPKAPDWILGNQFGWNFAGPLTPCNTRIIEFDARVAAYGYDCNIQNATAICEEIGVEVSDWDEACINALPPNPDLNVSDVTINYDAPGVGGEAVGPRLGPGVKTQCNNISAVIEEDNGVNVTDPFNVSFEVNGTELNCSPVQIPAGFPGGSNMTVYCNCSFYPIAGVKYNISVTVDSANGITESDETNNTMWDNRTAIWNGYKGDGWQGPDMNLTNVQCHPQDRINLTYSTGDSKYLSGYSKEWTQYTANWTLSDFDSIPSEDTCIKKALLYVYYQSDTTPGKNLSDYFTVTFNELYEIPRERVYIDEKGFGSWDYTTPMGMAVYNVTEKFGVASNSVVLNNSYSGPGYGGHYKTGGSITGMLLMVVYKHPGEPERIICIDEGMDTLCAKDDYAITSEEATTYAKFSCCEPMPLSKIIKATLVTVAPLGNSASTTKLFFNDGEWLGAWPAYAAPTNLGIAETNVLPHLQETDNIAAFQSYKPAGETVGDTMAASNAFFVLEKAGVKISVEPEVTIVQPQDQFDVNITVEALGDTKVYGVEYYLKYNTSVVRAETQNKGPFLGGYSDTIVVINDIDQPNGIVSYAETRKGTDGVGGKDTVATIQFTAIGARGTMSALDLFDVIVVDEDKNEIPSVIITDGTVTINDNIPPTANGTSKHEFNNVAKKYPCNTILCSCSYDDNYPDKGGNITYIRWAFGDGQYGTTEGLPVENCTCKEHKYESWQWDEDYVPFNVSLTVTDDGCPEETDTTFFDVNVFIAGDANGDGRVNILDAVYVGKHWGNDCSPTTEPCDDCYSYLWAEEQQDKADLNNDCTINILDAVIIGANWGHTAW
jgi:hypothetical protein